MIKHDYFKTNMQKYGLVIFVVFWGSYNNVSSKTPLNGSFCATLTKFGLQEGKNKQFINTFFVFYYTNEGTI